MNPLVEFDYLREVAQKYGMFYSGKDLDEFSAQLTQEQKKELGAAYEEIDKRQDAYRLSRWIHGCKFEDKRPGFHELRFAQQLGQLFVVFDQLAGREMAPFASRRVAFIEKYQKPVWSNVPDELKYLIDVAQTYAGSLSEADMRSVVDRATDADIEILARTAERVRARGDYPVFLNWLKHWPLDKHEEAKIIYSLFGVLDHAGLRFE